MKHLLIFTALFISTNVFADDNCAQLKLERAVNTDQKTMVEIVALNEHVLGLRIPQIFSAKIENYVSWKGLQVGCLANVFHRADIEIKAISPGTQICTTRLTLFRKNNFVSTDIGVADNKIENKTQSCAPATAAEIAVVKKCLATACAADDNNNPTAPDYQDDCACKTFDHMIQFTDEQSKYENFFDPATLFPQPEGIESPFTTP